MPNYFSTYQLWSAALVACRVDFFSWAVAEKSAVPGVDSNWFIATDAGEAFGAKPRKNQKLPVAAVGRRAPDCRLDAHRERPPRVGLLQKPGRVLSTELSQRLGLAIAG